MISKIEHQVSRWPWQIILVICIAGACGLLTISELGHQKVAQDYTGALDAMTTRAQLGRVARRLSDGEAAQRGFILTGDSQYLEPYTMAKPEIKALLDQLKQRLTRLDPQTNGVTIDPRIVTIADLSDKKIREIDLTIDLYKTHQETAALNIIKSNVGKHDMDMIRVLVDELQKNEDGEIATGIDRMQTSLRDSRWIIDGLATLNILLLVLVTFWLRIETRRAQEREVALDGIVQERTQQLGQLASHLQEVAEAEKTRLGRELHDELGAILTASKMDLSWVQSRLGAEQGALNEKLSRALKNLDQGIQIKRRIIEGLRPSTLASFGLMTAARELTEQAAEQARWSLELDLPDIDPDLSEEAEITLFRILQESITNIAKYAKASRVKVSLWYAEGDHCKLEIEDNGIGFRQTEVRAKAAGLVGMRERLRARGGKLDIRSSPGNGTLIRALLPLAKQGIDAGGEHGEKQQENIVALAGVVENLA